MDEEGRRLRHALAGHDIAVEVADQQAGGGDLGEAPAIGVHQEQVVPAGHDEAQVVADPLMQAELRRHAEAGGEVDARLLHRIGIEVAVAEDGGGGGGGEDVGHRNSSSKSKAGGSHSPRAPFVFRQSGGQSGGGHGRHVCLMARGVDLVGGGRVAVDQLPHEQRVGHRAALVLDLEQQLARVGVDDLDEAVLVLAVFLADQPALRQPRMDAAEVDEGQLDVVAVIGRLRRVGLAEGQVLAGGDEDLGDAIHEARPGPGRSAGRTGRCPAGCPAPRRTRHRACRG